MASNIIMFEDIFVVNKLDPDGKKFDKVTRVEATSHNLEMFMHLDVNTEVYPMAVGDKFTLAESDNKRLIAAEAVEEEERMQKLTEESHTMLQLCLEIHQQCALGEEVVLR